MQYRSINTRPRDKLPKVSCEINVTPLVDVMLVLLIIFMISSPMLINNLAVNLPQTKSKQQNQNTLEDNTILKIIVKEENNTYLNGIKLNKEQLLNKLQSINDKSSKVLILGDANINYGHVVEIASIVKESGYSKISLVTKQLIN